MGIKNGREAKKKGKKEDPIDERTNEPKKRRG
jgi:hypothetical protein